MDQIERHILSLIIIIIIIIIEARRITAVEIDEIKKILDLK